MVGGTTSITVAPGDAEATGMATVTIDPVDNALRDRSLRTIKIGGTAAGVNLKAATQTITIMDDEDAPTITVKASPATLAEDAGSVSVRITAELSGGDPLASAAVIELTVDPAEVTNTGTEETPITLANKNDFSVSGSKSITIPAGAKSASTTLRVTVVDDALFEQSETITIASKTDASVADATADDDTNSIANAAITITDNDFDIKMSVDTSSIDEDASDGVKVKVTATQPGRRSSDVVVMIAYEMGDEAVAGDVATGGATITIKAGEMSGETEVTIDPETLDNDGYEGDRTINVNGSATNLNVQDTSITITDDEVKPTVTLVVSPTTVNEDGTNDNVTVTATLEPNGVTGGTTITLELGGTAVRDDPEVTDDKHDYAPSITDITFTGDNPESANGRVDVNPVNDDEFEPTKTIIVSGKSDDVVSVTSAKIDLINNDFDVTISVPQGSVVNESEADPVSVVITATLTSAKTSPVTVQLNFGGTASSSEYTIGGTTTITLGAGVLTSTATITIDPADNDLVGGGQDDHGKRNDSGIRPQRDGGNKQYCPGG